MESRLPPILKYALLKRAAFGLLAAYSLTVSVLLIFYCRPRFEVLLQDESGTRRVSDEQEIAPREQFHLIQKYLPLAYRYSATTYGVRIEAAKRMMASELREAKSEEFDRIAGKLKGLSLIQCYDPSPGKFDIRYVDANTWEVDLEIHVIEGLKERVVPIRVSLQLARRRRTFDNFNAWEVKSYAETQGQDTFKTTADPSVCGERNLPDYALDSSALAHGGGNG
jgi:hypothetical protein